MWMGFVVVVWLLKYNMEKKEKEMCEVFKK